MLRQGISTIIKLTLIISAIIVLFAIKNESDNTNYRVAELAKEIKREKEKIHLLKAEFTYLKSPARIKELAERYLTLGETKSKQIVQDPSINKNIFDAALISLNYDKKFAKAKKKQWRYKRSSKYLQAVAARH